MFHCTRSENSSCEEHSLSNGSNPNFAGDQTSENSPFDCHEEEVQVMSNSSHEPFYQYPETSSDLMENSEQNTAGIVNINNRARMVEYEGTHMFIISRDEYAVLLSKEIDPLRKSESIEKLKKVVKEKSKHLKRLKNQLSYYKNIVQVHSEVVGANQEDYNEEIPEETQTEHDPSHVTYQFPLSTTLNPI